MKPWLSIERQDLEYPFSDFASLFEVAACVRACRTYLEPPHGMRVATGHEQGDKGLNGALRQEQAHVGASRIVFQGGHVAFVVDRFFFFVVVVAIVVVVGIVAQALACVKGP